MDEFEVMNLMNDINYGWTDKFGRNHQDEFNTFSSDYRLASPTEVIASKLGVCWDQVELERYYFTKTKYQVKTYFIVNYDNNTCPTHTFLVFDKDNKYYWFEHSWKKYRGIHKYDTLKELLIDLKNKFISSNSKCHEEDIKIYEYTKPKYHISVDDYFKHCESGKLIDIERI